MGTDRSTSQQAREEGETPYLSVLSISLRAERDLGSILDPPSRDNCDQRTKLQRRRVIRVAYHVPAGERDRRTAEPVAVGSEQHECSSLEEKERKGCVVAVSEFAQGEGAL